jgi:hypothetical protein
MSWGFPSVGNVFLRAKFGQKRSRSDNEGNDFQQGPKSNDFFSYSLFSGAPVEAGFTGAPPAGAPASEASTLPLIRITFVGSFVAFDVMVTLLLIGPMRFVSYRTLITEVAPGMIGSLSHFGTVHPQEPLHREMIRGSVPSFVTVNWHPPSAPCEMVP